MSVIHGLGDEIDHGAMVVVRAQPGMSGADLAESLGQRRREFWWKQKRQLVEEVMPTGIYDRSKARPRGATKAEKAAAARAILDSVGGRHYNLRPRTLSSTG